MTTGGHRLKGEKRENSAGLPLVTVITAVYQGAAYLRGCLDSVLAQDYTNVEHIVLDAGSTDGTVDILREYNDRLALWVSEPDQGVYDAWNKGVELARGEWIAFLGADDEYEPGAVSAYMTLAKEHPAAEYLCSRMRLVSEAGYTRIQGGPWTWPLYGRYMSSAHVGSMHRRGMFERYGRFDLSYRITADYEFLLRPRSALRAAFLPRITIMMRAGGMSESVAALREATRAKIITGGRARWLATAELYVGIIKFRIRMGLNHLLLSRRNHATPQSS